MHDPDFDPPAQQLFKTYQWDGKDLAPFTPDRQAALLRLKVIGGCEWEAAAALVRLCQSSEEEVADIRGEECRKFLLSLGGWMKTNGIGLGTDAKAKTKQLVELYDSIISDFYRAEEESVPREGKG